MVIRIEHAVEDAPKNIEGMKKIFIKSYGCQMNVYDSMRMGDLMRPHGYALVEEATEADLIVLNTCHIREKADEKVFSDIGRMKKNSRKKTPVFAVGGCVGQAMGEEIMKRSPAVKIVFGPQTLHRLPEYVKQAESKLERGFKAKIVDTQLPELEKFDHLPQAGVYGPTAFVTIQEGCDKFCTYCVVPYTRGHEISRPSAHILAEVEDLASRGVREVTLLGQNVNAYADEEMNLSFADLINKVAEVEGIERIRFTTSHPNNMSADLIELFGTQPKLMPYLHLPVQAGSNRILASMNRNHTAQSYLDVLKRLRDVVPNVAISGDFIVGFPGETEEDYMKTLELVAQVGYQSAYSFSYSPRPGTPAATMENQVDTLAKKERLAGLQALLDDQQLEFNQSFVGQTVEVLVEEASSRGGMVRGRNPQNVAVLFEGSKDLIGELVHVKIERAKPKSLEGALTS